MSADGLLDGYPVIVSAPIAWGDMDAFRHVNNTVYLRHFESARIAYFDRIDVERSMREGRTGPILHSTHCRFRVPLTYPDTVAIGARITAVDGDRFTMQYAVATERHGRIAADGGGIVVWFDYANGCKTDIPERIRSAIERVEA